MPSKLTRERLEKIKSWRETYGAGSNVMLPAEEAEALALIALAAMDSEPVAGEARFKEERPRWTPCTAEHVSMVLANPEDWPNYEVRYLYAAPQPTPVVPKSISVREAISALESEDAVTTIGQAYKMGWNACRAAMLQELKKSAGSEATCRSNENAQVLTSINPAPALVSLQKNANSMTGNSPVIGIDLASGPDRTVEVRYVAPPGYVMVPKEPTKAMILSAMRDNETGEVAEIYELMLAAAPQEVKGE